MNHFESGSLSNREWYNQAKQKADSFLRGIDASLVVEVAPVTVTTPSSDEKYETLCLIFRSRVNPTLTWTMEIEKTRDYIEHNLESAVRRIYREHRAWN
jgi:hypothetical protein